MWKLRHRWVKTGSRSCWWLERYRTDTHTQFCVFQAAASLQPFQCSQRCESVDSQQGRQKKCVLLRALHTLVMVRAPGGHREDFEWENSSQLHVPPPSAVPRAVSQWALDSMVQGLLSFTGALPQPITITASSPVGCACSVLIWLHPMDQYKCLESE